MQKISKIKIGKSITAVLLCVVLLVTSIPMVLAAVLNSIKSIFNVYFS